MSLSKRITFRTSRKEEWLQYCKANGVKCSDALRQVVEKLVNGKTAYHQIMEIPKALTEEYVPMENRYRVEVSLPEKEYQLLHMHAKHTGFSPGRWLLMLIRFHFLKDTTPLSSMEIDGLDKVLYEMRMIGRNLNQVARQLNNHELHPSQMELLPLMENLSESIERTRKLITTTLHHNVDRW